jgi:hypothetical protein
VIRAAVGIKAWIAKLPGVDEVRPAQCAGCGTASRPVGEKLAVHGHGLLERQLCGVLEVGGAPGVIVLSVRRYACLACKAVMTVVPAGMLARRLYSAPSIALALHLWLLAGLSDCAVRSRVCAWRVRGSSARGWAQLYRWARQPERVFALPRPTSAPEGAYAVAKRLLTTLRSMAPATHHAAPIALQIFEGAAQTR